MTFPGLFEFGCEYSENRTSCGQNLEVYIISNIKPVNNLIGLSKSYFTLEIRISKLVSLDFSSINLSANLMVNSIRVCLMFKSTSLPSTLNFEYS